METRLLNISKTTNAIDFTLLFCFTGHNLEKRNKNRQRETAVNSLVHYFES